MTRSLSRRGAVGAILGASAPLFAQDKAKRVIDDVLGALGGDRFLQVADRTEMGRGYSFYRERLTGLARARLYTRYLVRPSPPVPHFVLQKFVILSVPVASQSPPESRHPGRTLADS